MKKIYTMVAGLFLSTSVFAQAPQKMSYQAVIRNSNNVLIASKSVGMRISVLQGTATGTVAYSETQMPSTNANGLVSLEIGSGTPVTGTFAEINWSMGPYFIKTETDPTGGAAYSITGTNQLLSVPYALFSANSMPSSKPVVFGNFNNKAVNVTSDPTILGTSVMTFTKTAATTSIELQLYSRITSGIWTGVNYMNYELRIDGNTTPFATTHYAAGSSIQEYVSLNAVFTGLSAGLHTVTITAKTGTGTASNVLVDSGGFGGKIILAERY